LSNVVRVSQWTHPGIAKSTLYKHRHARKYPKLFIKFGGSLFVDLDVFNELLEAGRLN